MVSFLLLYLVLVFLPTLLPFNSLFLTPTTLYCSLIYFYTFGLFSLLYHVLVSLPTLLPYTGLFLTSLHLVLVFYLLLYLTLDSFTPLYLVLVFLSTPITLVSFAHPSTLCWSLYPLLSLTLVHFTLLYMVLVFLPNPITLCWSLSYSSTLVLVPY